MGFKMQNAKLLRVVELVLCFLQFGTDYYVEEKPWFIQSLNEQIAKLRLHDLNYTLRNVKETRNQVQQWGTKKWKIVKIQCL